MAPPNPAFSHHKTRVLVTWLVVHKTSIETIICFDIIDLIYLFNKIVHVIRNKQIN